MPLKIDIYSVMKNEIVLLPYFLRHYEQFADRIFIWDDGSTDGTRDMAIKHPKVIILPLYQKLDNEYMFKTLFIQYRVISRGIADWAMCVDADEFIYHPQLLSVLEKCKIEKKKKIRCEGFTMFTSNPPTSNNQIYDEIKIGLPCFYSNKPVVFNPNVDMNWNHGAHSEVWKRKGIRLHKNTGIKLLHYRYLGEEYYISKRNRNNVTLNPGWDPRKKHLLPDGTKNFDLRWFREKMKEAVNVVD